MGKRRNTPPKKSYDLSNKKQPDSNTCSYNSERHHKDGRRNEECHYTSPGLTPSSKLKKRPKKKFWIGLAVLLVLSLGGVGFGLWKSMHKEAIKPVITNPTKDVCLVTGSEALENPIYENIWTGMGQAEKNMDFP